MPQPKTKPAARASRKPKALETAAPMPAKPSAEIPEWVNETPNDNDYALSMWGSDGDNPEQVQITRQEYITLKRWLAALRGYELSKPMDSWDTYALTQEPESEQIAAKMRITQEEIQMALDLETVANAMVLNFRRRLERGAKVEPGKWRLDTQGASDIERYAANSTTGGSRCGLEILPATQDSQAISGKTGAAA